ncbi:hypothetical protein EIM50_17155 [Pseudoxanthomonas sp. SGD-10]|nr:hypothetical protein EIM50_17155 [Pseudoxanthomonas sp. SGD-10]
MRFLLAFFLLAGIFTCKRKDVYDLKLDSQHITLNIGKKQSIKILSGNCAYTISSFEEHMIEAEILENNIVITAKRNGKTTLGIEDNKGKTAWLEITINGDDNNTNLEKFSWRNETILLNQANHWGSTYSNHSFAISNLESKSQFYLTWEGGLSPGQKSKPVLKIVKNGTLVETTFLSTLYIFAENDGFHITFSEEHSIGEAFFRK